MKNGFTYNDKKLEITFSNKIEFVTSNFLSTVYLENGKKEINQLILNLSETKFITLPGAIFILCLCSYLKRFHNRYLDTRIIINSESLAIYLINIGFFSQMKVYGNLLVPKSILDRELKLKESKLKENNIHSTSSIIFPISMIPDNAGERLFEEYSKNFVNKFKLFFYKLCQANEFGFSDDIDESQELFGALHESIKNVYDHSGTAGFGAIHSSISRKGTIISFFDFGEGIINTVMKSEGFKEKTDNINAIYWALEDGNSRNKKKGINGNQGLGFTIIKNFVKKKNGMLTIRTGEYIINFKQGKLMQSKTSGFFPGTQIVIYVPLNIYN